MRIIVNTGKCIGSGRCASIDPDVFDQREEDGVSVLLDETPSAEHHQMVHEAIELCPAAAIRLAQ
ncbi:MAG TPA: ferredoxin [Streptosporangiaceae bacterium]